MFPDVREYVAARRAQWAATRLSRLSETAGDRSSDRSVSKDLIAGGGDVACALQEIIAQVFLFDDKPGLGFRVKAHGEHLVCHGAGRCRMEADKP